MTMSCEALWGADYNDLGWDEADVIWAHVVRYIGSGAVPGTKVTVRDYDGTLEADGYIVERGCGNAKNADRIRIDRSTFRDLDPVTRQWVWR